MRIPNVFFFGAALWRALAASLKGQQVVVPEHVAEQRLDCCQKCVALDLSTRQCVACACFVDVKTALATEKCPEGTWTTYTGRMK